jgi:hypothetical protein
MWLAGGVVIAWVSSQSFQSAERLFDEDAAVMVMLKTIGPTAGRALLLHQVAEQNRELVENWEYAEVFIAIFFFAFLLLGTREGKFPLGIALFMLLLALSQRFLLTPETNYLGRPLDFAAHGGSPGDRARLALVQNVSLGVEWVKWAAGILLAGMLCFRRQRRTISGYARQEIDMINKADHGHVDG